MYTLKSQIFQLTKRSKFTACMIRCELIASIVFQPAALQVISRRLITHPIKTAFKWFINISRRRLSLPGCHSAVPSSELKKKLQLFSSSQKSYSYVFPCQRSGWDSGEKKQLRKISKLYHHLLNYQNSSILGLWLVSLPCETAHSEQIEK